MSSAGCPQRFSFDAIGTVWQIDTPEELSPEARAAVVIEECDAVYSRFRSDSRVFALTARGSVALPQSGEALGALYRLTDGAMSPLVGGSLEQLGYDAGYSILPVMLDVGAAGKGQLVDSVSEPLRRARYPEHTVLDATTGRCVDTVLATLVLLADSALIAGALATGLFLVPPEVLLAEFDFDYVRISYSSSQAGALFSWSDG